MGKYDGLSINFKECSWFTYLTFLNNAFSFDAKNNSQSIIQNDIFMRA